MLSVDSFGFLMRQIEQDAHEVFTDVRDILALFGAYYVAKKSLVITSHVLQAINVHVVCQIRPIDKKVWVEKYGPWAVVTGGSEGIGQAYASELAKRGVNVVLISRSATKLAKAKAKIESETGSSVEVEAIVADFAHDSPPYDEIASKLQDREIGLLVNNVGMMYDYPDVLLNISSKKLKQLISVNIEAATMMTRMLLPGMVQRGRGGVVVFSSSSACQITPQMTAYAAAKSYLDYFLAGIAYEYRNSGVTFQSLVPFYVSTRMTGFSDRLHRRSWFVPNATRFAASAVNTLGYSNRTTGYFPHTIQLWFSYLLPEWLWMQAATMLNNSLRSEAVKKKMT